MSQSADSQFWLYINVYLRSIYQNLNKDWIKIHIFCSCKMMPRKESRNIRANMKWIISSNILWGWCWDSNFMNTISDQISSLSPYLNKSLPASAARRGQVCLWSPGLGVYVIVVIRIIFTPDEIMFILETKFVAFRFGYWNSVTYSRFNKNISDPRD